MRKQNFLGAIFSGLFLACLYALPLAAHAFDVQAFVRDARARAERAVKPVDERLDSLERNFAAARGHLDAMRTASPERSGWDPRSWNPLGAPTETSLRDRINQLVLQSVDILSGSRLTEYKRIANELQDLIRADENKIAEHRIARRRAPEVCGTISVGCWTQDRYLEEIEKLQRNIQARRRGMNEIGALMAQEFAAQRITLSRDQINALLYSVNGDDDVQIFASIAVIRAITQRLGQDMRDIGENIELAKKYFGNYAILMRAIVVLQEDYVRRIDEQYLKRLAELMKENAELQQVSRTALQDATLAPNLRTGYQQDIANLELVARTGVLFERHLQATRTRLTEALVQSRAQSDQAETRYRVVGNSAALLGLISSAGERFQQVMQINAPTLLAFENPEMAAAFARLSQQMRAAR